MQSLSDTFFFSHTIFEHIKVSRNGFPCVTRYDQNPTKKEDQAETTSLSGDFFLCFWLFDVDFVASGILKRLDLFGFFHFFSWRFGKRDSGVARENGVEENGRDGTDAVTRRQEDADSISKSLHGVRAIGTGPEGGSVGRRTAIGKRIWPDGDTNTKGKAKGHYETVAAAVEVDFLGEVDSTSQDIGKQENRHSTKNTVGDAGDETGKLAKDAK